MRSRLTSTCYKDWCAQLVKRGWLRDTDQQWWTLNVLAKMKGVWLRLKQKSGRWSKDGGMGWDGVNNCGDRRWLYLGYLQGDSVWQTFPWVYYFKKGYMVKGGQAREKKERISRCRSSLQMSKYTVNHHEDLRVLKCFLTESVSQPRGSRMTKTLTGVLRVAAAAHPSPISAYTIPRLCKHTAKPKWPPFRCWMLPQMFETERMPDSTTSLCTN